jgi:hypothetical protein
MTVLIPDIAEANMRPQPIIIGVRQAKTSDHEAWDDEPPQKEKKRRGEAHFVFVRMLICLWDHKRDFSVDIEARRAEYVERWLGIFRTAKKSQSEPEEEEKQVCDPEQWWRKGGGITGFVGQATWVTQE